MDITSLSDDKFADLFADLPKPEEVTDTTTVAPIDPILDTTETTTVAEGSEPDVDILSQEKKPGRKPKYDFSDISGYFEDRIKAGKFVPIEEETDEGKKLFIPKTPEEFDEVIELQVSHKIEEEKKKLESTWYQSKSPAWKMIARYSEMVDDPSELVPYLTGVKNIQSVQNLDPSDLGDAEKIVRTRLQQRGDDEEAIEEQISAFKTAGKLEANAEKLKPILLKEEASRLQQLEQEKMIEKQNYERMVYSIRENAIKSIETPLLGKHKLKQEEKAAIYDLIGEPSPESQGYGIYTAIDSLFEKGDFETLRDVALLLTNKQSYLSYVSTAAAEKAAANLQKKLRVAEDSRKVINRDDDDEQQVIKRTQFPNQVRFGRG